MPRRGRGFTDGRLGGFGTVGGQRYELGGETAGGQNPPVGGGTVCVSEGQFGALLISKGSFRNGGSAL